VNRTTYVINFCVVNPFSSTSDVQHIEILVC